MPVTSGGFNIDDGTSCGFTLPSDLAATNPGIDPVLAANGGPTATHALLPGSPAIDRGSAFGALADQRGLPRPSDFPAIANALGGDGSDIGAFELQAPPPTQPPAPPTLPAPAPPVPADTQAPNTRILHAPAHRGHRRLAVFRFAATEPGARFQCRLDRGPFRGCRSPLRRRVKLGARHVLRVRAIDPAGNVDPTPARYIWRTLRGG